MRRFRQDDEPFIDISDRPLEDSRPVGPFVGCGDDVDGGQGIPSNLGFTVDVDDRLHRGDTDPSHFEVVEQIVIEEMPSVVSSSDIDMEETRVGDVRVRLTVEDKTISDVNDIERQIDSMEERDDVINVYDVRFQQ